MNLISIWSDCKESFDLFNKVAYSVYRKMIEEKVVPKGIGGWGPFVVMFSDESVTFEKYQRIFPYDAEQAFHGSFSVATQEGYLKFDENGYRATETGEAITQKVMQAFTDAVAPLQPMPQAELKRLMDYLIHLCDTATAAPEPPSHFCQTVYKNYKLTFPNDAPLTRLFVHYYKELDFYRTDAHVAAWQITSKEITGRRSPLSGMAKRTRSINSTKNIRIAASRAMSTPKPFRNSSGAAGWKRTRARIELPPEGKRIREEAEALTDKYFFAPWASLNESELEELARLAGQLRDGLKSA
jgi:hypothetical protein